MDNTINSLVSQTVGVTDQQIKNFVAANINNPQAIAEAAKQYGVTTSDLSRATGYAPNQITSYFSAANVQPPAANTVEKLTNQILASSDPTKWSGQGFGSAQANAADMAKILAGTGITDIKQFGQVQKTIPAQEQQVESGDGFSTVLVPEHTVTTYGNKLTGQEVPNTYSERQTGNAFGGTFLGKGNTGYRVNFDAQGNPQFYTTGASSSNLKDFAPLLTIGGLALGAPYLSELLGGATAAGLGDLGAMGALGEGVGTGATLASLGDLGTMGALGEGAGTVAGMGAGTGLTAAGTGAAGLGGAMSTLGGEAALGSGITGAGAGAGTMTGLGGEAALGSGLGTGTSGLGATNAALGGSALGSTLGNLSTGVGAGTLGSTLGGLSTGVGAGVGSALGSGAASALGTSLATGLGLNALGGVLGAAANQSGISNARDLINQYGTQAQGNLAKAYADAQAINAANKADLASNYAATQGKLGDIYNQQVGFQKPYQAVGQAGSQGLIENQPYFTHQFDINDLNTNLAPNYAFMLGQGQMANQRAANAGGGALGGNALQGLQRYTQDYAGNAYQQAFNNYNAQRNNIYNSLAGMANIGQTSTGQLANLGNTYSSNLGGLSSAYGGNLTTAAGQGINAANQYGLNTAGLATGIGSALAGNATASGANTATALSNLGNTALLGSMIKAI